MSNDLTQETVQAALPDRPVRVYPALLSSEAEAMAWARSGASSGAVVVADYQVSPRGRAGLPLVSQLGEGLGFSMLLRPDLSVEREGWPYVAACLAVGDVVGGVAAERTLLVWPDRVAAADGRRLADLGLYVQLGAAQVEWVVLTVLVASASSPRVSLLAALVEAVEKRLDEPAEQVLAAYRERCASLGTELRALLIPLGSGGPEITGTAVDVLDDGALVLLTERGNRVAVRPTNLGILERPPKRLATPDERGSAQTGRG